MALLALLLAAILPGNLGMIDGLKPADAAQRDHVLLALSIALLILLCGVAALLSSALVPVLRQVWEIALGSSILLQLAMRIPAVDGAVSAQSWLAVPLWLVTYIGVNYLFYGGGLDRLGINPGLNTQYRFKVRATPQAVWNATASSRDTLESHWMGTLSRVVPLDGDDVTEVHYRYRPGINIVHTHTRLIWEPPFRFRCHIERDGKAADAGFDEGFHEMRCEDLGDGRCEVTLITEFACMRFSEWLMIWLDDWLGGEADAVKARLEGRRDWSMIGRTVDRSARSGA